MMLTTRRRADLTPLDAIQRYTDAERTALRRSLAAGWIAPVVVTAAGAVVDGAARIALAPDPEAIPVVILPGVIETDEARAMRWRLNATRGTLVAAAAIALVRDLGAGRPPEHTAKRLGIPTADVRMLLKAAEDYHARGETVDWSQAWETR